MFGSNYINYHVVDYMINYHIVDYMINYHSIIIAFTCTSTQLCNSFLNAFKLMFLCISYL